MSDKHSFECSKCNGSGYFTIAPEDYDKYPPEANIRQTCPKCKGTGRVQLLIGLEHFVSDSITRGARIIFTDIDKAKECAIELSQSQNAIFNVYKHVAFAYKGELGEPINTREAVKRYRNEQS